MRWDRAIWQLVALLAASLTVVVATDSFAVASQPQPVLVWNIAFSLDGQLPNGVAVGFDRDPYIALGPDEFRTLRLDGATGSIRWDTTFSGGEVPPGNENAWAAAVGADGNPVVNGGTCASTSCEIRTIKYIGESGQEVWNAAASFSPPGSFGTQGTGVALTPNGDSLVTGWGESAFGVRALQVLKYTKAGQLAWMTSIGGDNTGGWQGWMMAPSARGDAFVTGPATTDNGVSFIRVAKLDGSTGAVLWDTTLDASYEARGVGVGPDANPVVVAFGCPNGSEASCALIVIKLDSATGAVLWTATYRERVAVPNDPGEPRHACPFADVGGNALALAGNGDIVVACGVTPDQSMRVVMFDGRNGAARWTATYDTPDLEDRARGVAVASDLTIYVVGFTGLVGGGQEQVRVLKYGHTH